MDVRTKTKIELTGNVLRELAGHWAIRFDGGHSGFSNKPVKRESK
jgi:hypothetical protein